MHPVWARLLASTFDVARRHQRPLLGAAGLLVAAGSLSLRPPTLVRSEEPVPHTVRGELHAQPAPRARGYSEAMLARAEASQATTVTQGVTLQASLFELDSTGERAPLSQPAVRTLPGVPAQLGYTIELDRGRVLVDVQLDLTPRVDRKGTLSRVDARAKIRSVTKGSLLTGPARSEDVLDVDVPLAGDLQPRPLLQFTVEGHRLALELALDDGDESASPSPSARSQQQGAQ